MRCGSAAVEFQTPEMLTDRIAAERVNVYLSVEEAVVFLEVAEAAQLGDKRQAALMKQATEQLAILVAQVVEAHRHATANVRSYARLRGEP